MTQFELMRKFEKSCFGKSLPKDHYKYDKTQISRGVYQYKDFEMRHLFNTFKLGYDLGLKECQRKQQEQANDK